MEGELNPVGWAARGWLRGDVRAHGPGYVAGMLTFQTRKILYNRCDPSEALAPEDERNVDIDALGKERVRGVRWVDRLAEGIELWDRPVLELFTGLPGSGISTELRRLALRLGSAEGANLEPVIVDGEEVLDISSAMDVPDVLAAVVDGCERAVLRLEGKNPDTALQEGYLSRFWAWLTRTDVEIGKGELAVPAAGKLVVELKTRASLRRRVRETVANHLVHFLAEVRRELEQLNARAIARGRAGLVVLFDSLEKLRGTSTNWADVLNSAEQLFAGGAPYLRLPIHVIYTIPPALVSRRFERVHFIPMIKLRAQDGQKSDAGYFAMRTLVARRIDDEALRALLGDKFEDHLRWLIEWSAGYPRQMVELLRAVIRVGQFPLPEAELDRLLSEVRDGYRLVVPANAFEWLARVHVFHDLTLNDNEHHPAVDLMLSNNVVLRYANSHSWFDIHTAVQEIPGIQAEIKKLRDGR